MKRLLLLSLMATTASAESPGPPIPWPLAEAKLAPPTVAPTPFFKKRRVFINAGHGAWKNSGSLSVHCTWEMEFTRAIQDELAAWLRKTGVFIVQVGRPSEARIGYQTRLDAMSVFGAELMIDIHADVRKPTKEWHPTPEQSCARHQGDPGFSVLFNDDNEDASLVANRARFARTVARHMAQTGFPIYDGDDYGTMYEKDVPGVFRDRRGLMLLRVPTVPSIIIETHNHQNLDEYERWREPHVREAFYQSVYGALVEYFEHETRRTRHR